MDAKTDNNEAQLTEIAKAVGAILGIPVALFTIINSTIAQPITSLVVALIVAVLVSVWVILSRWVSITQIIIAWLLLAVVILVGFVIWPRTMTVEGFIYDATGKPVSNEQVVFFDRSGRRYEDKTNAEGYYQFPEVPSGKYRVQVRTSGIEGETKGILVRVVQQNLTVSEITPTATPTSTATAAPTNTPTATLTYTPAPGPPEPTNTPTPTDTPRPTPTPTVTIDVDSTLYDNFNNSEFDGKWNTSLWTNTNSGIASIKQENGSLIISCQSPEGSSLRSLKPGKWTIDQLGFVEAKVMLDSNIEASGGQVGIGIDKFTLQDNWWLFCNISGKQGTIEAWAYCHTDGDIHGSYSTDGLSVQYNTWHIMRFEINPDTTAISFSIDGQQIGRYVPIAPETLKKTQFSLILNVESNDSGLVTGYFDDVRVGKFGQ